MYKIKTEDIYENSSSNEVVFDFSNYSTHSKYYDDSNNLVIGKIKDKTCDVAIEGFFKLNTKMCLFLVHDNSEHKKAKVVNITVVEEINHNEYKDELLNNKCMRHSVN